MCQVRTAQTKLSSEVTRAALCPSSAQQPQHKRQHCCNTAQAVHTALRAPVHLQHGKGGSGHHSTFQLALQVAPKIFKNKTSKKTCFKNWYHLCSVHSACSMLGGESTPNYCRLQEWCMYWCTDCCAGRGLAPSPAFLGRAAHTLQGSHHKDNLYWTISGVPSFPPTLYFNLKKDQLHLSSILWLGGGPQIPPHPN